MSNMFDKCSSLQKIYVNLNTWIIEQANIQDMFKDCGTNEVIEKI